MPTCSYRSAASIVAEPSSYSCKVNSAYFWLSLRGRKASSPIAAKSRELYCTPLAPRQPPRSFCANSARNSTPLLRKVVPGAPSSYSVRSEEHTSELQSLMRISYAVFCLKKKKQQYKDRNNTKLNNPNKLRNTEQR